ncbi:hypothetical protein BC940DRAFT_157233 [Gongronella butleri]|nr:hypothetical protein BC940DRAFT_157233 [Gongronella butleri]
MLQFCSTLAPQPFFGHDAMLKSARGYGRSSTADNASMVSDDALFASALRLGYRLAQEPSPMTISGDEFLSLSYAASVPATPSMSNTTTPPSSPLTSILSEPVTKFTPPPPPKQQQDPQALLKELGRQLRSNMSLVKQRMMIDLKQSSNPHEQAIYTRLAQSASRSSLSRSSSSSSLSSTSIASPSKFQKTIPNGSLTRQRIVKKTVAPVTSCMELQSNENGFVSVVVRKKDASSAGAQSRTIDILARSLSFKLLSGNDKDEGESDDDLDDVDDADELLKENAAVTARLAAEKDKTVPQTMENNNEMLPAAPSSDPVSTMSNMTQWTPSNDASTWFDPLDMSLPSLTNDAFHTDDAAVPFHMADFNAISDQQMMELIARAHLGNMGALPGEMPAQEIDLAELLDFDLAT